MKAGSIAADFTPSDVVRATIIEAICCLIFATACLPASEISVMVFLRMSSACASARRTISSARARASDSMRPAAVSASDTRRSASARPFSRPSS